ncbi:MAG: hypothetical protein IPQ07_22205 [Myxococcales bacterium]|nr:hypothetical protein [Myxococcales bacterium]
MTAHAVRGEDRHHVHLPARLRRRIVEAAGTEAQADDERERDVAWGGHGAHR